MHNFRELKIWQRSMDLAEEIYRLTAQFPNEEKWGLRSQLRRTVVSVPSNIAEGAGRNTDGEFKQFLGIANGSASELGTQLELSLRLGLATREIIQPLLDEVDEIQRMMYSFAIKNLKTK
ncbi:MAG TPA: four helix bundle protein [Flavobacteriaceae bacterium]|nr:four helix bundle protein [Flavobacteriaceae bacterium]